VTADTTQPAGTLPLPAIIYRDGFGGETPYYDSDTMRAMMAERDAAREEAAGLRQTVAHYRDHRDALRRELEEPRAQKPIAMVTRGGSVKFGRAMVLNHWCDGAQTLPDGEHALYARPIPPDAREGREPQWISVDDERKPPGRTPILVAVAWIRHGEHEDGSPATAEGIDVTEGEYVPMHGDRGDYFESFMGAHGDSFGVTHWMPLPAAPVESIGPAGTSADGETQP
jgi:hypothetical protein